MKLTLKNEEKQLELVKAMASKDPEVAYRAQASLAAFIGKAIAEVVQQAPTLSNMFTRLPFLADQAAVIPLDTYYNVTGTNYVTVWSTSTAGGLPTNQVHPIEAELPVATYTLDTALSFDKKYARLGNLDVVGKSMTRAMQEVMLKEENISAKVILGALAAASTNSKVHVQRAASAGVLIPKDINELRTLAKRIAPSWAGGTPAGRGRGFTDLLISPEVTELILDLAYNPINVSRGPNSTNTTGVTVPEADRKRLFDASGVTEFMGLNLMEFYELGVGQKWNNLFDVIAGSTTYAQADGTTGAAAFDGAAEEIIIGVDRTRDSMFQLVATDQDSGSELNFSVDDQYSVRQNKVGFWGQKREGRVLLDNRALSAKII